MFKGYSKVIIYIYRIFHCDDVFFALLPQVKANRSFQNQAIACQNWMEVFENGRTVVSKVGRE